MYGQLTKNTARWAFILKLQAQPFSNVNAASPNFSNKRGKYEKLCPTNRYLLNQSGCFENRLERGWKVFAKFTH